MQNTWDQDGGSNAAVQSAATVPTAVGERVYTEPIDEHGHILLETRVAADGTKKTRKITRKGWPVRTIEECMNMDDPLPPEPD